MPSPEQPSTNAAEAENPQEQLRYRTIALRVNEDLHSQLSFIAQLCGSSISEEIRRAIEGRIASAGSDPDLIARAQEVRDEIEREAAARTAAIAGFMGKSAVGSTTEAPRARRSSKTNKE